MMNPEMNYLSRLFSNGVEFWYKEFVQEIDCDVVDFWDMWLVQDLISDGEEFWCVEFFVEVDDGDEPPDKL